MNNNSEETQDNNISVLGGEQLYKLLVDAGSKAIEETMTWLTQMTELADHMTRMTGDVPPNPVQRNLKIATYTAIVQRTAENYANSFARSIEQAVGLSEKDAETPQPTAPAPQPTAEHPSWKRLHEILNKV